MKIVDLIINTIIYFVCIFVFIFVYVEWRILGVSFLGIFVILGFLVIKYSEKEVFINKKGKKR